MESGGRGQRIECVARAQIYCTHMRDRNNPPYVVQSGIVPQCHRLARTSCCVAQRGTVRSYSPFPPYSRITSISHLSHLSHRQPLPPPHHHSRSAPKNNSHINIFYPRSHTRDRPQTPPPRTPPTRTRGPTLKPYHEKARNRRSPSREAA